MKRFFQRMLSWALLALLVTAVLPRPAAAATTGFTDVPASHWAAEDISRCVELGLFQGETPTRFGTGHQMTRAAFAVVLCRFFGWELVSPETGTYTDVQDRGAWYYSAVETAYAQGAITRQTDTFRPQDPITREELAVMLVRALGYNTIAGLAQDLPMPFTDVESNTGYIAMAYEMGIISGTTATTFSPERTATREQAAVMLIRLYDKYYAASPKLVGIASSTDEAGDWRGYEAVAISGGRLSYGSRINVSRPASEKEQALQETIRAGGGKALLHVAGLNSSLRGKTSETAAALAEAVAAGGYDGLYLDFDQLREERRAALTALVQALPEQLEGKLLYVAVDAPVWQGADSNAYDYAALGAAADRLVVRVAAYEKKTEGFTTAPPEPLEEVYYALAQLRGQVDADKLCLLLTTTGSVWEGGKRCGTVDAGEIAAMLAEERTTEGYYSNRYAAAFLLQTIDRKQTVAWYLDSEAARARAQMCALFGVERICLSDLSSVSQEFLAGLQ